MAGSRGGGSGQEGGLVEVLRRGTVDAGGNLEGAGGGDGRCGGLGVGGDVWKSLEQLGWGGG